jgi:hypothetical protein
MAHRALGTRWRWSRLPISSQSRHPVRTVRTHRSAYAFATDACGGIFSTYTPVAVDTASKATLNAVSRSRTRNRNWLMSSDG